ncbi:MAG TPA: tetratricopeptide repeat protein [Janthinobacterium sp.]|jgi:DNA-binding response OmpR family regulator/Tfp pilus assembly protein PilF|nr:tetratricopeptide repeat protein [Janthinobacterium sp.]
MQEYSNLSVLIIDPNPGMRGSLHNMLNQSSISKIEYAVSSGTAIRQLSKKPFDIVLCEYDLGSDSNGQDGQQLLEDLRHHKLIGMLTIFIMLTSEGVYSKVVSAAELTPTDYILKPFTVEVLVGRIGRALERRAIFLSAYQLIGQGNLREAIKNCGVAEANHPRYATEFARLRAELHMSLGETAEAEQIYLKVLENKPLGWAQLGLAKSVFEQERYGEANDMLAKLIEQNPRFMAAYDLLAKTHKALGAAEQAKKTLEDAVAISPHMVRRLRSLGEVALETGDIGTAEKAFKQVVTKAKYSEFRDPEDHVNLVKTLVKKGDANQAGSVVRDLERSLRGSPNTEACRAIASALVMDLSGNAQGAAEELSAAVAALEASKGLSTQLKLGLAQSCLTANLDKAAADVMLNLTNDSDSGVSMERAVTVLEQAGRHDLAQGLGAQITQQVQDLMTEAADKVDQGEHRAAVIVLNQALRKTPDNLALLFAAVDATIKQLNLVGWESPLAEQVQNRLQSITKIDPKHARLAELREQYAATQRKYGIAG